VIATSVAGYFVYTKVILVDQAKQYIALVEPNFATARANTEAVENSLTNLVDANAGALKSNATVATDYEAQLKSLQSDLDKLMLTVSEFTKQKPAAPSNITNLDQEVTSYYTELSQLTKSGTALQEFMSQLVPLYKEAVDLSNKQAPNPKPANAVQIEENIKFMREVVAKIDLIETKLAAITAPTELEQFKSDTIKFVGNLNDFIAGSADVFDDLLEAYKDRSNSGITAATDAYNRTVAKFKTTTDGYVAIVKEFKANELKLSEQKITKLTEQAEVIERELARQKTELGI
jgi:hypothetical protein